MVMPYKNVFHLQIFKNAFVNCLRLDSPEVGSEEDSCESEHHGGAPRRNQQEWGEAATAAQGPSTEGGLRLEPLEAKPQKPGDGLTEPISWLQAGQGAS